MFRKRKIVFDDITAGQLKEIHFDTLLRDFVCFPQNEMLLE